MLDKYIFKWTPSKGTGVITFKKSNSSKPMTFTIEVSGVELF
jgi:hypothetical protein